MKVLRTVLLPIVIFLVVFAGTAQKVDSIVVKAIQQEMALLRKAHLNSDTNLADQLYHPDLVLTSQSGKKYEKEAALANIENSFEHYENYGLDLKRVSKGVVLANYVNERKYEGLEMGKFRLTVVWTFHEGSWRIISMQSSRIKEHKP